MPHLHQNVCYKKTSSETAAFDVADCSSANIKGTTRVD